MPRPRASRSSQPADTSDTLPPSQQPRRSPGRKAALSAMALEALGAPRLAALLMAAAGKDPVLARSLRLAVAGTDGAGALAAAVEKRLDTLARSRGAIAWSKVRSLARELDGLRGTIATTLAEADLGRAAGLMRRLLELAGGLLERCEDGGGAAGEVFTTAATDLGAIWAKRPPRDPLALAGEVLGLMEVDDHGVVDGLLEAAAPALGAEGRSELRRLLQSRLEASRGRRGATRSWEGHGLAGWHLRRLADVEGDADAFAAAVEAEGNAEAYAADVARRLLAHGRAAEALAWLDRAASPSEAADEPADEWEALEEPDWAEMAEVQEELMGRSELRAQILDALERGDEARALRWEAFARWLQPEPLRAILRSMPGFADVEAEDRAMTLASNHPDQTRAVAFLAGWPNLPAAARLVREHHAALDGSDYRRLRPAAEALAERHPVAATLLRRRLVEGVLVRAASRQYGYAARDLRACAALASFLPDEPSLEDHDAFLTRLRREHGRKHGFWTQVEAHGRR